MKNYIKGLLMVLGMLVIGGITYNHTASADQVVEDADTSYEKYIAFGADLTAKEKAAVLQEFGISESDLSDYKTVEITNKEEHEYLGDYIDSSVIGKRALSSVMVVKTKKDSGVQVSTDNISYCTSGMYCNALVTAGLTDAQVKVVGPFKISGTSALVGAMKAYGTMTGKEISDDTMDTATNELVTTADLGDSIGKDQAAELVAAVKQKVFSDGLTSSSDIRDAVESSAKALNLNISDEQVDDIVNMMEKVSKADVDVDAITSQAKDIYNKLKDAGVDFSQVDTSGLVDKVGDFFANIFDAIADFFTGLFG